MDEKEHGQVLENAAYEMGTLYYFLAKNVIEAYGESAEEVIRKGIREWGAAKGSRQREKVKSVGLEPALETLSVGSTMPWGTLMEGDGEIKDGVLRSNTTRCPLADVWRERNGLDLARLYCEEVDAAKWRAFNPKIRAEISALMARGDDRCLIFARMEEEEK